VRAVIRVTRPGYDPLTVKTPFTAFVRSTPVVRLAVTPGDDRLTFRVTARATGVKTLNNTVKVFSRGKLIRAVPLRNGVATATLTRLHDGTRTYRFRLPSTRATERVVVIRRIHVR
jgi:hypothetical protein